MTLFNLPIGPTSARPIPHVPGSRQKSKKRKAAHLEDDDESGASRSPSPMPDPAITNPLSLTPHEVAQYRVAGLTLDERLPAVRQWPHRPLPGDGSKAQAPDPDQEKCTGKHHLRVHHLAVLTTVLHRCLQQGDIPRASRAWALVLRTQIEGRAVDLRTSGYWGKGAELLIRAAEKLARRRAVRDGYDTSDAECPNEADSEDEGVEDEVERRWGTPVGLELAKDYYERLILQYPYIRHLHRTVTALDFYPAMFACEIYGVQCTQKEALRDLDASEDVAQDDRREDVGDSDGDSDEGGLGWEKRRERERVWTRREEIRQKTLHTAEIIAHRMDALMAGPPYSDSPALQRLRGNLALYVGDLHVPAPFGDDEEEEEEEEEEDHGDARRRERHAQRRRGRELRGAEQDRAEKCFARMRRGRRGGAAGSDDSAGAADE